MSSLPPGDCLLDLVQNHLLKELVHQLLAAGRHITVGLPGRLQPGESEALQPSRAQSSKKGQFGVLQSLLDLQLLQQKEWPCQLFLCTVYLQLNIFVLSEYYGSLRSLYVCGGWGDAPTYSGKWTEASQGSLIKRDLSDWGQFRTVAQSQHPETQPFMTRSRELSILHKLPHPLDAAWERNMYSWNPSQHILSTIFKIICFIWMEE